MRITKAGEGKRWSRWQQFQGGREGGKNSKQKLEMRTNFSVPEYPPRGAVEELERETIQHNNMGSQRDDQELCRCSERERTGKGKTCSRVSKGQSPRSVFDDMPITADDTRANIQRNAWAGITSKEQAQRVPSQTNQASDPGVLPRGFPPRH